MPPLRHYAAVISLLTLVVSSPAGARELDRYLFGPDDLPSGCQRIEGLFPINDNVTKLYDGKDYRKAMPKAVDRHAQSVKCGDQKGTIYFYQFKTVDEYEKALLFARPVLSAQPPVPELVEWNGGFAVVSFLPVPEALFERLRDKVSGVYHSPKPAAAKPTAAPAAAAAAPAKAVVSAPTPTVTPLVAPAPTPAVVPAAAPPPAHKEKVPAPVAKEPAPPPADMPADVSDQTLNAMRKTIDCRGKGLPEELKEACTWLEDFRKGETMAPVIGSSATLVGVGYRLDGAGRLDRQYFEAAIGNGRIGELGIVSVYPANGVDELELRSMATKGSDANSIQKSEAIKRATNVPKPTGRTFTMTKGKSWLARRPRGQTIYLRRSGEQWIMLGFYNTVTDPSEGVTISVFR